MVGDMINVLKNMIGFLGSLTPKDMIPLCFKEYDRVLGFFDTKRYDSFLVRGGGGAFAKWFRLLKLNIFSDYFL